MSKTFKAVAVLSLGAFFLTGCGGGPFRDLEGVKGHDPDRVEIVYNVDGYPNIVRICVDKVAFATTTREAQAAIFRVPEWDATFCGGAAK